MHAHSAVQRAGATFCHPIHESTVEQLRQPVKTGQHPTALYLGQRGLRQPRRLRELFLCQSTQPALPRDGLAYRSRQFAARLILLRHLSFPLNRNRQCANKGRFTEERIRYI